MARSFKKKPWSEVEGKNGVVKKQKGLRDTHSERRESKKLEN